MQIFNSRVGLYGVIYEAINGTYPKDIFADAGTFRHMYVWSGVWQNFGWSSIIYVSALAAVPDDLHEAAKLDGASTWKIIRHIDLPAMVPTIVMMLIMNVGSLLSVAHDKILLMQAGTNIMQTEIISTYVYKIGVQNAQYSYSTAIGLFNAVVNFALLLLANYISKKTTGDGIY